MSKLGDKIKKQQMQLKRVKKALKISCKQFFKEETKKLFEENPTLINFSWTQYTPYFNDGDVCRFYAHTDYPCVNDLEPYGESEDPEIHKLQVKVCELLGNFTDDDLLEMFGDHAQIIVTKEKIEVSNYDHE